MRRCSALLACALACARTSAPPPPPAPAAVDPPGSYFGQPTLVRLRGAGFTLGAVQQLGGGGHIALQDDFRAFLGTAPLQDVRWVDLSTLLATVPANLPPGTYGLSIEGPYGSGTVDSVFRVVDAVPASLSASATAPAGVHVGVAFTVSQAIANTGGMTALGVAAGAPQLGGPLATIQAPTGVADIPAGGSAIFTWSVIASATGTLQLTLPVDGIDEVDHRALGAQSTLAVSVVSPAHLVATPQPVSSPEAVGLPIQLSLGVVNDGGADAVGVAPAALTGTTNVSVLGAPVAQDVPAGATRTFVWRIKGTAPGTVTLGTSGSGTDAIDGSSAAFAPVQWNPITFVTEAAFDATLTVPPGVLPGETLTVTFAVNNPTAVDAQNVQPALGRSGTAAASLVPQSAPAVANIAAGQTVTFIWTYTAGGAGTLQLDASARGTDASSGGPVSASRTATTLVSDAAPVAQDPFADGTAFSYVFAYAGRVYLGPSQDGTRAVRMQPDGTGVEAVQFHFVKDPNGVKNSASLPPPPNDYFPSLGFLGCTQNTLQCGPDNEDGRGLFTSFTSGGTEWLFAAGDRQQSVFRHTYVTTDTTTAPSFSPTFVNMGGGMRGATAAAALGTTLYVGIADGGGSGIPGVLPIVQPFDSSHVGSAMFPGSLLSTAGTAIVDSMAIFNGALYAANAGSCGRYDGVSWTSCKPSDPGWTGLTSVSTSKNSDFVPSDKAVPAMAVSGAKMYFARNTTSGPQLWACSPATGQPCTSTDWAQVAPNTTGNLQLSQFDDPTLGTVSLLAATAQHLYVGYDSAGGVALFRSTTTAPSAGADFQRWATSGLGANLTQIVDGHALTFGTREYVYLSARSASGPVQVYRVAQ
ncbi:MAG: hypothetical protein E6J65_03025 [Deltaproteobacteria bacterium]|nr:MAG: hypothetical protein E6J65_03025 [Deltaproteobacteria bacterium]